jgi:hypothetical protein
MTNPAEGERVSVLTIADILAKDDLGEKEVNVPEWGGSVVIRGLGYGEFVAVRDKSLVNGEQDETVFGVGLLAAAFVNPVLTEEEAKALFNKSSAAVVRITGEIVSLSGIGGQAFVSSEADFS